MTCKNCNAVLFDGTEQCPLCGTPLEVLLDTPSQPESLILCKNCGYALEEGTTLCPNCGQRPAPEAPTALEMPQPSAQTGLSHTGKRMTLLGCIAAALVVVIVLCIVSLAGSSAVDLPNFIIYGQENRYFLAQMPGGTPVDLGKGLNGVPMITIDGENIFYLADNRLTVSAADGTALRELAADVQDFKISADGRLVYFLRGEELYLHDLNDSLLLARGVLSYHISADGRQLVYTAQQGNWQVLFRYAADTDETYELGRSETVSILDFSDDLQTVLYLTEQQSNSYGTLYMQTGTAPSVLISGDANLVSPLYADGSFYYTVQPVYKTEITTDSIINVYSPTLYYYDGNSSIELCDNFLSAYRIAEDQPGITYSYRADNTKLYNTAAAVGGKQLALDVQILDAALNPSATKLLFSQSTASGKYSLKLFDIPTGSIQEIDSSTDMHSDLQFINNDDYCYFTENINNLISSAYRGGTLYLNGTKVSDTYDQTVVTHPSLGILFLAPDEDSRYTGCICDLDGNVTELKAFTLHDGFYSFTPQGHLVYADLGTLALYLYDGSTNTLIAENAMGVVAIPTVTEAY